MTFFKTNHAEAGTTDFELLPEGKYEAIIESGTLKKASTGSDGIEFVLKVRDDVEGQKFGGRKLWYRLWFTENTTGMVNGFLDSIGTPDGKEFSSAQEMADYATGRAVVAVVKHKLYEGKTSEDTKYLNKSLIGGGKIDSPFATQAVADPFAAGPEGVKISDDDLPF